MLEKANKIYDKLKDIKYGWKDKSGKIHSHINEGYVKKFRFQSCNELEKSRVGICWETLELSRKYLEEAGIKCKSYFFVIPNTKFYCHSCLVFQENGKYYWFENSFINNKGINEFNTLDDFFFFILSNFNLITNNEDYDPNNIKIYEYTTPKDNIDCLRFYFHCFKGKNITNIYLKKYLKLIEDSK